MSKKLENAQQILCKNLKTIFVGFNDLQPKLSDFRNQFIKHTYDYLKVLRIEDKNKDNHSFNKLTRTIFELVNLDESKNNHSYFRKFANTCVQGALLLHWQDEQKIDDNEIVLNGLEFATKNSVVWIELVGKLGAKKNTKKTV